MFYHIKGTVAELFPQLAVIDCGGLGFAVNITSSTASRLKTGETVKLFTYLYVREDVRELYGFYGTDEKRCFELLIGVSGVGPKAALSVLSASTPASLTAAVVSGDEKALTVAPGIGKKIAQRIILELKDKLSKDAESLGFTSGAEAAFVPAGGGKLADATAALAVLGYGSQEISAALKGLDTESLSLEDIIRRALQRMVK